MWCLKAYFRRRLKSAFFYRKKPLDEKALLSPSQETLATQDPPSPNTQHPGGLKPPRKVVPAVVRESAQLPPLKQIPYTSNMPLESATPDKSLPMPNLIEDEVESDTELGLDVEYAEDDPKSKVESRASTAKSILTQVR